MRTTSEIRKTFIHHFTAVDHQHIASSSLIPDNDPTLMFTNSGMVQFKDCFTGKKKASHPRAVTCQKCLRAGGKHNDLDNVGYTARHHTFFEMLGNFSFGDYFKERAIGEALQLLTQTYGIRKDSLLVTVYHTDEESYQIWRKHGFPEEKIIPIATNDNFWQMGNTGPCGPCSEIFYDYGEQLYGGPPGSKDENGDRFTEIWNLVFMQYEQFEDGSRKNLPKPSVDTGMGLERIASVLQGRADNYDTTHLRELMERFGERLSCDPDGTARASLKVMVDHLRASSFLIADGIGPDNVGRGYVLRRIMRRGMLHAHILGSREPIFCDMLACLVEMNKDTYPELLESQANIYATLHHEETQFAENLSRGLHILEKELAKLPQAQPLPGDVAFRLYDTHGFPLDMTIELLKRKHIGIDTEGFTQAMQQQKEQARQAWKGSGDHATSSLWFEIKEQCGEINFSGYTQTILQSRVLFLMDERHQKVQCLQAGEKGFIITKDTVFYAQSGGQLGDTGTFKNIDKEKNILFSVQDTQRPIDGLIIHKGKALAPITLQQTVHLEIDIKRRKELSIHHSGTHLLHLVLRDTLGDHVRQKGSLVSPQQIRFDFSHHSAIKEKTLAEIEDKVNEIIRENNPISVQVTSLVDAKRKGALAFFGDKYGEKVRMVVMGRSKELCGGTHVHHTGEIGFFKIHREGSIASGVRRIEATCMQNIATYIRTLETTAQQQQQKMEVEQQRLTKKIKELLAEIDQYKATSGITAEVVEGYHILTQSLKDVAAGNVKSLANNLLQRYPSSVLALATVTDNRATLVVAVCDALTKKISALDAIQELAPFIAAKGAGGRRDMAQTGGRNTSGVDDALKTFQKKMRIALQNNS